MLQVTLLFFTNESAYFSIGSYARLKFACDIDSCLRMEKFVIMLNQHLKSYLHYYFTGGILKDRDTVPRQRGPVAPADHKVD